MGAKHYNASTRERISDLILGLHVQTTDGVLTKSNFNHSTGQQTELFTVVGRIGIKQLFIELTAAADANATQVTFNCTFTTPAIGVNAMQVKCASIANLGAYGRIMFVGGAVAAGTVSISDSAGLTDLEAAGRMHILGGVSAAGVLTVGTIGMLASDGTQAATITATAHLFYVAMCPGAYAEALL